MNRSKILYVQYTNPAGYPPLDHSSRILAGREWHVLFLGVDMVRHDTLELPAHSQVTVLRLPFCPPGWRQKIHYFFFLVWAAGWAIRFRPFWIYVSDPLACPVGVFLHFLGFQLIYHEHDSPDTQISRSKSPIFACFMAWARRQIVHKVPLCILPNRQRAERFIAEFGHPEKVLTVWNCPLREEVAPRRVSSKENSLHLLYHGSIGADRIPFSIFHAIKRLPESITFSIIGIRRGGNHERDIENLVEKLQLGSRVKILGPMTRHNVLLYSQECDVGIVLESESADINLKTMIGASNKVLDYLACGAALLVTNLPNWEKTYVDPGYGLACNPFDPSSIQKVLQWFLDHPEETRTMGERGRQKILDEWNYEKQFEPVLQEMNK